MKKLSIIQIICPVCSQRKDLEIPDSVLKKNSNTATISIPPNLVCEHHFQAFVDQWSKVRGYQKIDYILQLSNPIKETIPDDKDLLEHLELNINTVVWKPEHLRDPPEPTLEELYNEFDWLIPDDSTEFEELIKDRRS